MAITPLEPPAGVAALVEAFRHVATDIGGNR